MRVIKHELSRDIKELRIIAIGDLHKSDKYADNSFLDEKIELIKRTGAYYILVGDLLNNSIIDSVAKAAVYDELKPGNELIELAEKFKPIAPQCLGVTTGNHERRADKYGIDLTALFCVMADIPLTRYGAEGIFMFVTFGQDTETKRTDKPGGAYRPITYQIYCTHGSRGGRTDGGKVNALTSLQTVVTGADVYISAHTHQPAIIPGKSLMADVRNRGIISKKCLFISVASAITEMGGYAEIAGYKPLSNDNPVIYLCGTRRAVDADFGMRRTF